MKTYLDLAEIVDCGEREFIRADVTGMTEAQITEVKTAMKAVMGSTPYTLDRHFCRHEDNGTCTMQPES